MKLLFKIKNIKRMNFQHWVEVLDFLRFLHNILSPEHGITERKLFQEDQSNKKLTFGNFNQRGHQTKCMVRIVATIAQKHLLFSVTFSTILTHVLCQRIIFKVQFDSTSFVPGLFFGRYACQFWSCSKKLEPGQFLGKRAGLIRFRLLLGRCTFCR